MSTPNADTGKNLKSSGPRLERTRLQVKASGDATEEAITHLVRASYGAIRSFVPPVVLRPTETLTLVFDLVDQVVDAARRLTMEVAEVVEAGLVEVDRTERVERRAA